MSTEAETETAPFADIFPTAADAQRYITEHDAEVVQLDRRKVAVLQEEYRRDLAGRGIVSLSGGVPRKRDDLVRHLADSRFPRIREAQRVHAWHHNRAEHARQVVELSMRLGLAQDDFLAEVLQTCHPEARARLRRMLAEAGDE